MKEEYDRWEEDEEIEPTTDFDECRICINKYNHSLCKLCSLGELFEEEDPDDLMDMFEYD